MAGQFPLSSSRTRWPPISPVIGFLFWHVLVFLQGLDVFLVKASGHVIRSPNECNLTTTPLTNLIPQQPDFDSFNITGVCDPSSNYISLPSLPSSCSTYNFLGGECSSYMAAVNVTYDDWRDPWTLCHCSTANMSLEGAVERLGKVPVGLRKYVGITLILPGEKAHAYCLTNGDLHMFGDCRTETWIHEATHSYDYAFELSISGGQGWLNATDTDSCAPDIYGTTNAAEEFAQMSVLKIFSLIYGALPSGWEAACMSNQLAYLDTLPLYNKTALFSDTCAASPPSLNTLNSANN